MLVLGQSIQLLQYWMELLLIEIIIISMLPSDNEEINQIYSKEGVRLICELFEKKKPQPSYIVEQQQFYRVMETLWNNPVVKKHKKTVIIMFNKYYLLTKFLYCILRDGKSVNNIGDFKVIKVIIKSFIYTELTNFKRVTTWRPQQMKDLIAVINKKIQKLLDDLKLQLIFSEDVEGLYSLKKLFKIFEYTQIYQQIANRLNRKGDIDLPREKVSKLFAYMQQILYEKLGEQIMSEYTGPQEQLNYEKIKLALRYIKYSNVQEQFIFVSESKCKLALLTQMKGYLQMEQFFDRADMNSIAQQKQFYKIEKNRQDINLKTVIQEDSMPDSSIND